MSFSTLCVLVCVHILPYTYVHKLKTHIPYRNNLRLFDFKFYYTIKDCLSICSFPSFFCLCMKWHLIVSKIQFLLIKVWIFLFLYFFIYDTPLPGSFLHLSVFSPTSTSPSFFILKTAGLAWMLINFTFYASQNYNFVLNSCKSRVSH